ncbi:MAG: UDP-3-O-(3-hydroxymyristoyl)glucosamine N-acyltransferase [Deferribacteraceae bacterium]|jgi:UDP-3-O-[3-hydroxymyristoyl] glucosamine N-acyltransferase|nr:UDP-3-O-(3-hydroxymyristoyl)glucosamine N-acyltransferase [Deferribacteraceae bacterium]
MPRISELAERLGGKAFGADVEVSALCVPEAQAQGAICILGNPELFHFATGASSAYVVPEDYPELNMQALSLIKVAKPREAMTKLLIALYPEPPFEATISPNADVAASAQLGKGVRVESFVAIGKGTVIGDGACIKAGAVIGANVQIGAGSTIFPRVVIYDNSIIGKNVRIHAGTVIGCDGFGYILAAEHTKIPHIGNVIIGDNVEIGANAVIDRGTIGSTIIGKGTKIDNLYQVGHNNQIGEHCVMAAQGGMAGSSRFGNYMVTGGQVGFADHLVVGNGVRVAAKTGVMHNMPDGATFGGIPGMPHGEWLRQVASIKQLPELRRRVKALEDK